MLCLMFALDFARYAVFGDCIRVVILFPILASKKLGTVLAASKEEGCDIVLERREDELFDLKDVVYFVQISSQLIFAFTGWQGVDEG